MAVRSWGRLTATIVALVAVPGAIVLSSPSSLVAQKVGAGVSAGGNGQSNSTCVTPSAGSGNCQSTFGVTVGSINPIYPSQTKNLPVTWSNPNSFDIIVDTYTATVSVPSGTSSKCTASNLQVPSGTQRVSIPVGGKNLATTTISTTLLGTVPDACQRVAFKVTINATAVKK